MNDDNVKKYDLAIIGAGPAGLTASIYASRYNLKNVIIGQAVGGLIFETHKICNFPTEKEISGQEITKKMKEHAESLGGVIIQDKAESIEKKDNQFLITTALLKEKILAKALILAIGTEHRKLGLDKEDYFLGRGISYCPTCDGMFYKNKTVALVGGADSANVSSLYLADIAEKVYQIYRRGKLRGEAAWIDQVLKNKKIEVIYNTNVIGLKGGERLEKIVLDKPYKGKKELEVSGLFIEIGSAPSSELIKMLNLETDNDGYIVTAQDQSTSEKGVWAAGDVTTSSNKFRQVITACSEGAIAVESVMKYLQK